MNIALIMAMIQNGLPIVEEFIKMGIQIVQAIQAAQGTPAAPHVQALADAHAAMGAGALNVVKAAAAAMATPAK